MIKYGEIVQATVTDENQEAYFVQAEGRTFTLYKDQLDEDESYEQGEEVEGLIYEDKNRKALIQLDLPDIRPGYFGWGEVNLVRRDLGVFVDIGLYNKDIVVSLDDLPDDHNNWPKAGDKLYLSVRIDDKDRFWGVLATEEEIQNLFIKAPDRLMNQDVQASIYQLKLAGAQLITDEGFRAFIHESEWILPPRLGEQVKARVTHVQPDGSLNLSLKPRAHEAISDDAQMILKVLEKTPDGFLALHDKSDPEDITSLLAISKGQFKRAVGSLMKERLVRQEKGKGIFLTDHPIEK